MAWYNTDWLYRKKITIDCTKVDTDQVNFPVYINLASDTDLPTKAQSTGNDIVFTAADGETKLAHDLPRIEATDIFAGSGIWCWFADPRAVYSNDKTFVGWVDMSGDIVIGAYNHTSKSVLAQTLWPAYSRDDHANPALLVLDDGNVFVMWSDHNGDALYYAKTNSPGDITGFTAVQTAGDALSNTYPNLVRLSDESNKLYCFYRGGSWYPRMITSTDDGDTWSAGITFINPDANQRPYVKVAGNDTDEIHIAFSDRHPTVSGINDLLYFYYKNDNFYKADGTLIKAIGDLPIELTEAEKLVDGSVTSKDTLIWDIAIDTNGRPVIVYALFENPTDDHRYRYLRWNGSSWVDNEITAAGGTFEASGLEEYYSGGVILDHDNTDIVYASIKVGSYHEIQKWTTSDSGVTWAVDEHITSGSSGFNVRPVVPRNSNSDLPVLWFSGEYPSYVLYETHLKCSSITIDNVTLDEAHVLVPSLSASIDTDIYMYYGNASVTDQSNASSVWLNDEYVLHGDEMLGAIYESSHKRHFSKRVKTTQASGKIGRAVNFEYKSSLLSPIELAAVGPDFTMYGWVKFSNIASQTDNTLWMTKNIGKPHLILSDWKGKVLAGVPTTSVVYGTTPLTDDTWTHIGITCTSQVVKVFYNGEVDAVNSSITNIPVSGYMTIGRYANTGQDLEKYFTGLLDEFVWSNTTKTEEFIKTVYTNQASPGLFYSFAEEESRQAYVLVYINAKIVDCTGVRTEITDDVFCITSVEEPNKDNVSVETDINASMFGEFEINNIEDN